MVHSLISRIASDTWREELSLIPKEGNKFDSGKPRMDLVPPEMEEAVAQVLAFGASKYGERNWEHGMKWGRPYAALKRHINAWWGGEDTDDETGMSHLWHAACCIAFLVSYEKRGIGTDDRNKLKVAANAYMATEEGTHRQVS